VGEWWPSGAAVLAINPANGHILWRANVPADALTVWSSTVYTGFGCQNLCRSAASYGLDLNTGRVLWKHAGNFGWQPVLLAGRLYQTWSGGYGAGYTQVYDPESGTLAATLPLVAQWFGDRSTVLADVLIGPARGSWLGRITPSGKPAWKLTLGKAAGRAAYAYHTVFASSNRFHRGILAVSAGNGKILWATTVADNPLAVANHILFAQGINGGPVYALDTGSGKTLATFAAERGASALVAGGTLYVVDHNGLTAWGR
jgi:outer membrane protein assembly factor BamB